MTLEQKVIATLRELPPNKQREVLNFAQSLQNQRISATEITQNDALNPETAKTSDYDPITPLIGTLQLGTTDLAEKHDTYLGQTLTQDLSVIAILNRQVLFVC